MTRFVRAVTLAAFGGMLIIGGLTAQSASAHESHPGLEFSIGVRGVPGCNTRASDVTCTLPSGQPFMVEVGLDALPDDIPSYLGFDLYAEFSGGVTPSEGANNDDWHDCGFPAAFTGDDFVGWGCAIGVPPAGPSSWIGPIGTVTFTCSESGSITMVHSDTKTDLLEALGGEGDGGEPSEGILHTEGSDTQETLTITCGQVPAQTPGIVTGGTPGGPGPTPGPAHPEITGGQTPGGPTLEPTAAARATQVAATAAANGTPEGTPDDGPIVDPDGDDGDSNTWVWIVIIVAAVAAVGIAGGGYWYMRNRSGGGAGGGPTSGSGVPSGGAPTSGAGSAGATPSSGGGSTAT